MDTVFYRTVSSDALSESRDIPGQCIDLAESLLLLLLFIFESAFIALCGISPYF